MKPAATRCACCSTSTAKDARKAADFEVGIQYALSRLLVDPNFLYRFEREPADVAAGDVYALGDLELASRLSFFLWSSIPDEELLAVAAAGRLREPSVLASQVERLLDDERAQRFVENFAGQWLKLRELDAAAVARPRLRRGSTRGVSRRDRAVVRRGAARAAQRARAARRRLHVS